MFFVPRKRDKKREKPKDLQPVRQVRPNLPYWEDPVYRYVSGLHKRVQIKGNAAELSRLAELMQKIVNKSLSDEIYFKLDADRKEFQRKMKQLRKKQQKSDHIVSKDSSAPSINIAELKRRIFNPQTSSQNMIKALEAMPAEDRKKTIQSLTPYLKSKIAKYLQSK